MTGPVLVFAAALTVWAAVCLVDWWRERCEYERRSSMWADLLAQLREPSPDELGREWRRYIGELPEMKR